MQQFIAAFTDPANPFHLHHMGMALEEAAMAESEDEVPVGAIILIVFVERKPVVVPVPPAPLFRWT